MRYAAHALLNLIALPAMAFNCDDLAALRLANTTITLAQTVGAGAFAPSSGSTAPVKSLPAFCRVAASLAPSPDSDIRIEVWLPAPAAWNGRFQAVGNGGWAGTISYAAMARALSQGYATASTDTGHATPGANFATNHPEKLIDFGYRAVHELTVQAEVRDQGVLRQRSQTLLLEWLLHRRTAGTHGSATLPGGL